MPRVQLKNSIFFAVKQTLYSFAIVGENCPSSSQARGGGYQYDGRGSYLFIRAIPKPNNRTCGLDPKGFELANMPLEVGAEVTTIDEVPQDRGLEVEAQIQKAIEEESGVRR